MSNTLGTICRVIGLFLLLLSGWFLAVTALYTITILVVGSSFEWNHVGILFGGVVLMRMFYPRNVFKW
jgi:ABC-type transport system involved in cytochrome bd biosynthesis fused ATPase/permease subunit